jgi:hypothetical protein
MIKHLICLILGHKLRCRRHNLIKHDFTVDPIYVCIVRCLRCYGDLEYYLHYSQNCGKQYKENSTDEL